MISEIDDFNIFFDAVKNDLEKQSGFTFYKEDISVNTLTFLHEVGDDYGNNISPLRVFA
jgi:hypothetical protein